MSTPRKAIVAAAAMWLAAATAGACDVPVWVMALREWPREPYRVGYFYRGKASPADAEANALLERLSAGKQGKVNLTFSKVDVAKIADLPADALGRLIWEHGPKDKLPCHVIITPRGAELFAGRLKADDVRQLTGSPLVAKIAEPLSKGGLALLILQGPDQAANAAARKVVDEALAGAAEHGLEMTTLTVRRDDPKQRWLVRQLLAVEDDLAGLRAPMVFAAFGRGRVLPPCVGKGVTPDHITADIEFLTGPCACEYRSGVGLSLVTNFDWVAALPADLPEYSEGSEGPYRSALVELGDETEAPGPPAPAPTPAAAPPRRFVLSWLWVAVALAAGAILAGGAVVVVLGRREHQ